jgi:uncharacterized protein (DUF433 family)
MKSDNDLIQKFGKLTLEQVRTCIFAEKVHINSETETWNQHVEDIIRNMKY